jgi:hypothetical protein
VLDQYLHEFFGLFAGLADDRDIEGRGLRYVSPAEFATGSIAARGAD